MSLRKKTKLMLAASSMLCDEGDDDENDFKVQFIKKENQGQSSKYLPTLKVVIEFCSTFREQKTLKELMVHFKSLVFCNACTPERSLALLWNEICLPKSRLTKNILLFKLLTEISTAL